MLDDYGQKWNHTPVQFELNRKFSLTHNPTIDIMTTDPDIYDNYKSQVNAYGETSVYKSDCGQFVPKSESASGRGGSRPPAVSIVAAVIVP